MEDCLNYESCKSSGKSTSMFIEALTKGMHRQWCIYQCSRCGQGQRWSGLLPAPQGSTALMQTAVTAWTCFPTPELWFIAKTLAVPTPAKAGLGHQWLKHFPCAFWVLAVRPCCLGSHHRSEILRAWEGWLPVMLWHKLLAGVHLHLHQAATQLFFLLLP